MDKVNILDKQIQKMLANKKAKTSSYNVSRKISKKARNALIDLELNHNNSWAVEMFLRNKNRMDNVVLEYRGRKIRSNEFWSNVFKYCKSFKEMGISKGQQIPVMVSNSPEFIYCLAALNLIGAVSNIVGEWFAEDYLVDIIKSTNSKTILVSDDINDKMKNAIKRCDELENIVTFSLTDSLPKDSKGNYFNPYHDIDDKFGHFKNNINLFKKMYGEKIIIQDVFIFIWVIIILIMLLKIWL